MPQAGAVVASGWLGTGLLEPTTVLLPDDIMVAALAGVWLAEGLRAAVWLKEADRVADRLGGAETDPVGDCEIVRVGVRVSVGECVGVCVLASDTRRRRGSSRRAAAPRIRASPPDDARVERCTLAAGASLRCLSARGTAGAASARASPPSSTHASRAAVTRMTRVRMGMARMQGAREGLGLGGEWIVCLCERRTLQTAPRRCLGAWPFAPLAAPDCAYTRTFLGTI